jgi:hypothetical protein
MSRTNALDSSFKGHECINKSTYKWIEASLALQVANRVVAGTSPI